MVFEDWIVKFQFAKIFKSEKRESNSLPAAGSLSMLFVTKARGKMWNFQRSYYLAVMGFYVNMIERPGKIRFGPLSMIYRKAEFIEAKEIHSGMHIKKIDVFHLIDQFNGFLCFSNFLLSSKGYRMKSKYPIQYQFDFFVKKF